MLLQLFSSILCKMRHPERSGRALCDRVVEEPVTSLPKEAIFFEDGDQEIYCDLLAAQSLKAGVDPTHLIRAVRYVSLNPVRARLVARAEDWRWSSVRAHLDRQDDALVTVRPILARVSDFSQLLRPGPEQDFRDLRDAEGTGRPLGTSEFVAGLETILGRKIARRAPDRKPPSSPAIQTGQLELL